MTETEETEPDNMAEFRNEDGVIVISNPDYVEEVEPEEVPDRGWMTHKALGMTTYMTAEEWGGQIEDDWRESTEAEIESASA